MESFDNFLKQKLKDYSDRGLQRKLSTHNAKADFTSNDYLGLARSADLFQLVHQRINNLPLGNGSTGSRLLSGNNAYTEEVEFRLGGIFHCEHTLLFNSGYTANLAVLSSLPQKGDTIIYDELAHACIKDGARLSLAKRFSFRHNNVEDLKVKIRSATGRIYVVVESIYSMDGDECPLNDLVAIRDEVPDMVLVVDEAHSTGVIGAHGSGLCVSLGHEQNVDIRIHTFGKAMGVHGACVAGSTTIRDYLINFARPFIYTTAPSPHSVAAIDCSFDYLSQNLFLQQDLQRNVELYSSGVREYDLGPVSKSQIQTVIIPGSGNTRAAAAMLQNAGYDVRPILSPTVSMGLERLRICLHSYNTEKEIINLCALLKEAVPMKHNYL